MATSQRMNSVETHARRLSALIVNHDSGAWALRCVESLQREWERDGRDPHDLEIIVIDSGSNPAESTWWRSLRRQGARVKNSPANVGYATGLNMAFELSRGGPDDFVALLNPDLYFLAGSLRPLMERLEAEPKLGAVGPRLFLDEERVLRLPQNLLPTPARELGNAVAARFPRWARWLAAGRSLLSREFWTSEEAVPVEMLSGACLFMRRETILESGEPMDGRYPLYFEDADLCSRLAKRGYELELVPDSEVLHHWSRSAGPNFEGEVATRHAYSRALWMATHHRGLVSRACLALQRRLTRRSRAQAKCMHDLVDLGEVSESPTIRFPALGRYTLELSLTPFWGLAAGVIVEGAEYALPARTWSWLFPGTYYLRALDGDSGQCLGAWSFQKLSPSRSWPLDPASLPAPRRRVTPIQVGERVG